jgi:hypothetical protein
MPKVGGRHFAYTPEGRAAAERYKQSIPMHTGGLATAPIGGMQDDPFAPPENIRLSQAQRLYRTYTPSLMGRIGALMQKAPPYLSPVTHLGGKALTHLEGERMNRAVDKYNSLYGGHPIQQSDLTFLSDDAPRNETVVAPGTKGGQELLSDLQDKLQAGTGRDNMDAEQQSGPYHPDMNMFRDGGMMGFRPLGYADGDLVSARPYTSAAKERFAEGVAGTMMGAPVDAVNYGLRAAGVPVSDAPVGGSESISNAVDTVRSLVQEFMSQDIPDPVKAAVNAAIGAYGIPVDLVNSALGALGLPVSETPVGGSRNLKETFGMAGGGMMGFRPLGYADGDLVEEYVYPDKESRQSAINFIMETIGSTSDSMAMTLIGLSDFELRRAELKVAAEAERNPVGQLPQQILDVQRAPSQLLGAPAVNPQEKVLWDAYKTGTFADFQKRQPSMGVNEAWWRAIKEGASPESLTGSLYGGTPAYELNYEKNMLEQAGPGNFPMDGPRYNSRDRISDQDVEYIQESMSGMKNGGIMALRRY